MLGIMVLWYGIPYPDTMSQHNMCVHDITSECLLCNMWHMAYMGPGGDMGTPYMSHDVHIHTSILTPENEYVDEYPDTISEWVSR